MLANLLQTPGFIRAFDYLLKEGLLSTHISVTRPLEQEIPTQEVQGSVEPVQLSGSFCQLFIKALSAATVEIINLTLADHFCINNSSS
jgi:hypothetical protein